VCDSASDLDPTSLRYSTKSNVTGSRFDPQSWREPLGVITTERVPRLGLLARKQERTVPRKVTAPMPGHFALMKRKGRIGDYSVGMEILALALGMSNRVIAGKLFVRENAAKTLSIRVFDK
jgi:hypothetical protein